MLAVLPASHYRTRTARPTCSSSARSRRLSEDDYLDQIVDAIEHRRERLPDDGARLYQNGVVLERKKYRLLGYAYRIFLARTGGELRCAFVVEYFYHLSQPCSAYHSAVCFNPVGVRICGFHSPSGGRCSAVMTQSGWQK